MVLDNLTRIEFESRDAQEIVSNVERSYLEPAYTGKWSLDSMDTVVNKQLQESYRSVQEIIFWCVKLFEVGHCLLSNVAYRRNIFEAKECKSIMLDLDICGNVKISSLQPMFSAGEFTLYFVSWITWIDPAYQGLTSV